MAQGTLPERLRRWATNRKRCGLDPKLLREAADEIEKLRARVKELESERNNSAP